MKKLSTHRLNKVYHPVMMISAETDMGYSFRSMSVFVFIPGCRQKPSKMIMIRYTLEEYQRTNNFISFKTE